MDRSALDSMKDREHHSRPRRVFFRNAAARLIGPLADYIDERTATPRTHAWLRPPGAIEESELIETCRRCGACVEACPADAIFPLAESWLSAIEPAGTPAIDPERAACVVCDGLQCTTVCPSGALLPVADPRHIRMGLAEVYAPLCVRSREEICTLCVDHCPMGEEAIRFPGSGAPEVLPTGCVGCGVCQLYCPTSPKAIVVKPHEATSFSKGNS